MWKFNYHWFYRAAKVCRISSQFYEARVSFMQTNPDSLAHWSVTLPKVGQPLTETCLLKVE